jgi:hypothetical protein
MPGFRSTAEFISYSSSLKAAATAVQYHLSKAAKFGYKRVRHQKRTGVHALCAEQQWHALSRCFASKTEKIRQETVKKTKINAKLSKAIRPKRHPFRLCPR